MPGDWKLFERIQRTNLKDEIVNQVTGLIVSHALAPGDRIPSERELAQQLGVSRVSIREAVQVLETLGLLEVKRGVGTFVRTPMSEPAQIGLASSLIASDETILELYELREIIETACAARAARRASATGIASMREALEKLADGLECQDVEAMASADVDFHRAVTLAAGNALLTGLMDSIGNLVRDTVTSTFRISKGLSTTLEHHAAILEAIQDGDAEAASDAMARHVREAAQRVRGVLELGEGVARE